MRKDIDVTNEIEIRSNDLDCEALSILKCVCGKMFDEWDFIIDIYKDKPRECPKCGRKFYFRTLFTIYEVIEQ